MDKLENVIFIITKWILYILVLDVFADGLQLLAMKQSRDKLTLIGMGFLAILSFLSARRLNTPKPWPKITAVIIFIFSSIQIILAFKYDGYNALRISFLVVLVICISGLLRKLIRNS